MALRITRKPTDYISETAFMYDVAQTSKYFDKSVYQGLSALGDQDGVKQYLYGLAGYKDKDATAFNQTDYDYLQSPEDKASYVLYKLSGETDADTDAYFEYKIQEAIDKRTYESLNWFEKTTATVGGVLGNVLNETLLGTTEGLIDTLALGFGTTAKLFTGDDAGAKQFMTKDITGVAENRADLQKFARKYTYIDKNGFTKGVNDVAVALGQMLPLALNIVAPGVGTVVYTSAMAGNAAANAVEANPDIDYLALNGYYFGMVGLSLATGKISQKILGGSGNLIDDLMYGSSKTATTKIGEFASKNLATKLGFSFLSEGLEESIEEFADVVLYNTLVAKNDLTLEQEYSIKEILYAGLIGGLVGGLADSVGIAFTKKSVLTEDGRIMTKAEAEKLNLKVVKELSKFETISFNDKIQQAQALLETNLDARADLLNKYPDLTEAQIQEQHYTEYMEALEKNEQIKSKANEVILGLSKVLDLVGEESFIKAIDLANTTLETQQRLMDDYVAKATGKTAKHIEIAEKFKKQYPTSSITISDTPTAQQKRLIQNMKNAYGIDVYFGTIGEKNGRAINYAVTLDENTIVIDEKQASNLSEQALLNEVVKEELVHTIQFTKNLITPRLLAEIQYAMGNTEFAKQTLNAGYDLDTPLNQISEAQAKAVAQVLLFDNLTVSKMFYTQYSTLNGVYKKFLDIKNWLLEAKELRSQKGKMKFNMLLKSMKMYRDIAAEKLGTAENVEQFVKDYQLTELEQKQLRDAYLENPEIGPIEGFETEAYSKQEQQSQEIRELLYNEDGTPKTFYKGGNTKGITEFNALAGEKYRTSDKTAWVSDSLAVSKSYSNEKQPDATIYSLDLTQISNPKIIDAKGAFWNNIDGKTTNQLVDEAIAENKGYDAVIIKNVIDPGTYSTDRALANPATSIAVIDPSKIKIVSESPRNEIGVEKQSVTLKTKTGEEIDLKSEINKIHKQFVQKAKRKRTSKISAGTQLDIFDYIDENLTELEKENTRLKAVEQELDTVELRDVVDQKTLKDKADKLREICSELVKSEYQGDIENHKFATLSNEIFEKEASFFGEITSNEWQALYKYLITQLGDVRADAAANAVLRYGYLHRKQFTDIQDLIKVIYANKMSSSAQLMGLSSHDYNNHSIQSFINEVAIQNKVAEIPLPKDLLLKTAPEYKTIDEFTTSVETEIKDLTKQIKDTTDPYTKWELNRQKASKERILTAIEDNEIALALDEQMSTILESNENVTENLQKQADTYRAIIEWLLEHATFDKNKLSGFSDKKIPLSKNLEKAKTFFEGLESFRYMMMLSNPATAVKNAASNTLILGQSYIEDFGTKILEKSKWLSEARQGSYTGEYDKAFSDWVKNTYLERIKSDAEGDKYTSNELRRLQQQYAEAKDPIKKNKLLNSIQSFERKMLSDKFWVTHRTIMNLTNTLAGTSNLILSDCEQWLISNYRNGISAKDITKQQLINNISKTNKELADLYSKATAGDKVAVMELATKLNLDIVSPDLKKQNSIYYHSFYRANKMFFKIDNTFTRWSSDLGRRHPAIAYVVRHFMPFVRVTANATSYIIDRSPIGLAKGIFKALQTKAKWSYQKRYAIEHYYIEQYTKTMRDNNPKFKFNQAEFETWMNENVNAQTISAINGDKQALDTIFEQMVEQGMINSGQIGSDNLFARAESMELISQGFLGTAIMGLGILLGAVTDAFDYDDEELYGPVVKLGDIKIGIGDLSPFSTLFTMGAMMKNKNIDNKIETMFTIFADATILSTLDSALSYSNGAWDYFKNQSVNIIAQYQPAITKAMSKIIHNTKKDKSGTWSEKLIKTLGANSLLFNYLVPNKINPYTGEPEKYYDTGWFEGLFDVVLPVGLRVDGRSAFEKEAEAMGAETTGMSGSFTINDTDYKLTGKDKEKYAKYKAQYINKRFESIVSGKEKVTIKDEKTGKYKTVKYESLNKDEKQRVLKNLYTTGTTVTKIQYWLDKGNSYIVTDRDQYYDYKKLFGNSAKIVYKNKWSTSKFVEG